MVVFINFLRALAAMLITNSHYIGIYPYGVIAHGGIIGNIMFFAVSGYCLYNLKLPFHKWYVKRFTRVYIPLLLITLLYIALKVYNITPEYGYLYYFLFPTRYTFVSAILILYIPYYLVMKIQKLNDNIPLIMLIIFVGFVLYYVFAFDRWYYHIDDVTSTVVYPLYAEGMLLGAYYRKNDKKYRNRFSVLYPIMAVVMLGAYYGTKHLFNRVPAASDFQIVNQLVVFALLFFLFRTFMGLDGKLEKLPKPIHAIVNFVSKITLEIYLVQLGLLPFFRTLSVHWTVKFVLVTASIIASAFVLHYLCDYILKAPAALSKRLRKHS